MNNSPVPIKPDQIVEIVLRRRFFVIIPLCISIIVGLYYAITLPKIYEAETLILVQPQRVPTSFVQSIVSSDINERISTISQQILSRTNLEMIMEEYNLFSGPNADKMFHEDKLANLRQRIQVKVTNRRRGTDAFSISFRGKEPQVVMKVVNTLAAYFIDENLKVREAQAIGTSDFLESQLEAMRQRLEEVEEAMKEYRRKYMGELPEQLDTNLSLIERLHSELENQKAALRSAKENLSIFRERISSSVSIPDSDTPGADELSLVQMKEQLARLLTTYTERHPDVVKLKKTIADLEEKIQSDIENSGDGTSLGSDVAYMRPNDARRLRELSREVETLTSDIQKTQSELDKYNLRVENTPKREQELLSLRRDYQNIQDSYSSLLNRKLEAEIAVNMERKQKGEQFRIVDTAKEPEKPISPDMRKLFLLTIALGFGIGGGVTFLLEYFDTSLKTIEDTESFLNLPVMCTVPTINHPEDIVRKRTGFVVSIISLSITLILFLGFSLVVIKGADWAMNILDKILK